jgi:FkbM family methyltransferase
MIINLIKLIIFVLKHPSNRGAKFSALLRVLRWQIASRLMPSFIALPYFNNTYLFAKKGMTSATSAWYCGLYEFEEMSFLSDYIKKDDLFVDIGANIGVYSILAASMGAKVIAIEPMPSTYETLKKNVSFNNFDNLVDTFNIAISDKKEKLNFSNDLDALNHVLLQNEDYSNSINISACRLDEILNERIPKFIKIDVEGFETKVFKSAKQVFANNNLKCVIIELIGGGKNYGFDEEELHQELLNYGFSTYSYIPSIKKLINLNGKKNSNKNTLYLRENFKID